MSTKHILFILFLTFMLNNCGVFSKASYSDPEILIKNNFSGDSIAVLDFVKQGSYLPSNLTKFTADKLNDALFLIGRYKVIDRSEVRKSQSELKIPGPDFLDKEQIRKLGAEVDAKYIVLGRLFQSSASEFLDTESEKTLRLSFRIISTESGEVTGIASTSCNYKENVTEVIETMIRKTVEKMRPN